MTHYIQDYIDLVRSDTVPVCQEQILLVDHVERVFATETLIVDETQLEKYMGLQKHFPYKLLPWETFLFALHNCVYTESGELRWPILVGFMGRGSGKNGYLSFEDFCLLTPINGIQHYNIDIFATAEETARVTFDDIWQILEDNKDYFSRYFTWTKEEIVNKATRSKLKYRTAAPKTKDSFRPGKVDFDEVHGFENKKLIGTAVSGLGKCRLPRRTYISSFGDVRGSVFDSIMERAAKVLSGEIPDNGWLYFICRLDSDEEIMQPEMWYKANPSLSDPSRPELLKEIQLEFLEYQEDPAGYGAFATKRMGRPQGDTEAEVTSWDNILAASEPLPDESVLIGRPAVFGIDYANTQDFVAAGILIYVDGMYYWITHSWVCAQSKGLSRIQFPIAEAAQRRELTMVNAPEISPDIPVQWVCDMRQKYNLIMGGIDHFRYTLLSKAFADKGFDPDRKRGNLKLTYSPEQSMVAPMITSAFLNHKIVWGDNMLMRWYTNNAIRIIDKRGNITYGKIEPKSRKTDGFMALVAAFIVAQIKMDELTYYNTDTELPEVFVF